MGDRDSDHAQTAPASEESSRETPCAHDYRVGVCRACRHIEGMDLNVSAPGFRRRVLASIEDQAVTMGLGAMILVCLHFVDLSSLLFEPLTRGAVWPILLLIPVAAALLSLACLSLWGGTSVGKRSRGLRVVRHDDGTPPKVAIMLVREGLYKGILVTFGIVFSLETLMNGRWAFAPLATLVVVDVLAMGLTFDKRTLTDRVLRTRVVLLSDRVPPSAWRQMQESWREFRRLLDVKAFRKSYEDDPSSRGGSDDGRGAGAGGVRRRG